jgi:hypothetical protein
MEDPKVSDEYAWKPGPNDLNPTKELSDHLWNIVGRNGYEIPQNHLNLSDFVERSVLLDATKTLKAITKNYDKRTEDGKSFLIQEIYGIDRRVIMRQTSNPRVVLQRLQRMEIAILCNGRIHPMGIWSSR